MTQTTNKLRSWEKEYPSADEIAAADNWRRLHPNLVARLIENADCAYQPTEKSDCRHPELWTPAHWKWADQWGFQFPPGTECLVLIGKRMAVAEVIGYNHAKGGIPILLEKYPDISTKARTFKPKEFIPETTTLGIMVSPHFLA